MDRNISLGMVVLSLVGLGITFQMAEDTMNRDIEWMMEASLMDYINPLAVIICTIALVISLTTFILCSRNSLGFHHKNNWRKTQ